MAKKPKIRRCAFSHYNLGGNYTCVQAGWGDDQVVPTDKDKCAKCKLFKSRYIEYPLTINGIKTEKIKYNKPWQHPMGSLVGIRPCGKRYKDKTYLGIYLGDLPKGSYIKFNRESGILTVDTLNNPAIYVPELRKIIFGCESWWYAIENEDQLREISDDDINNTWYVRMAKALSKTNKDDN